MTAISSSTITEGVFDAFFTRLNTNLTDPGSKAKWIYSSFPDLENWRKTDFPLIIIAPSNPSNTDFTFGKRVTFIDCNITVYSTKALQSDQITDDIIYSIESYRATFRASHNLEFIRNTGTSDSHFMRDGIKMHARTISYNMQYRSDKP